VDNEYPFIPFGTSLKEIYVISTTQMTIQSYSAIVLGTSSPLRLISLLSVNQHRVEIYDKAILDI
jgi:hypothetical protein